MPFQFQRLEIEDVILIEPKVFNDERGYFLESYKKSDFNTNGISDPFIQDNISHSSRNVIRGLHYQIPPFVQGKLVRALEGEILDVAVDIRKQSATYGKWIAQELSGKNRQMLYIPPGFAHGFCVLSETATVMYKCTTEYNPECDRGIRWDDPEIGIGWPVEDPVLSEKDLALPRLSEADNPF